MEPVLAGDEAAVAGADARSDAEERLYLVPRGEDHERREERQDEQRHPEADVRPARWRCGARSSPGAAPARGGRPVRSRADRATACPRKARFWGRLGHQADCSPGSIEVMVADARRLPVETLAHAAAELAVAGDFRDALGLLAGAAAESTGADLAVVRVLDGGGDLAARAVAPQGSSLGAEVAGTRVSCDSVAVGGVSGPTARAAERVQAAGTWPSPRGAPPGG